MFGLEKQRATEYNDIIKKKIEIKEKKKDEKDEKDEEDEEDEKSFSCPFCNEVCDEEFGCVFFMDTEQICSIRKLVNQLLLLYCPRG